MPISVNYITCREENGSIHISEDVIASLVRSTVGEVDEVSLSQAVGAELAEFIGLKNVNRGLKVSFEGETVIVDAVVSVNYGCGIVSIARQVQEKVISALQSATGLEKVQVNVHVAGIVMDR